MNLSNIPRPIVVIDHLSLIGDFNSVDRTTLESIHKKLSELSDGKEILPFKQEIKSK